MIYGAIIALAVVVALQAHPPRAVAVAATLLGTAVAVGLAELYSDVVGTETRLHRRVSRDELREMATETSGVVFGIAFPAVFFVLAAANVMEEPTAFRIAKWSGLGLIGFYGFSAARLADESVPASLLRGATVGLIGAFLIALKALVH